MFDPGGSKGRLCACPFWGTWCVLLCGEVSVLEQLVAICRLVLGHRWRTAEYHFPERGIRNSHALRSTGFSPQSSRSKKIVPLKATGGYRISEVNDCQGASWSAA